MKDAVTRQVPDLSAAPKSNGAFSLEDIIGAYSGEQFQRPGSETPPPAEEPAQGKREEHSAQAHGNTRVLQLVEEDGILAGEASLEAVPTGDTAPMPPVVTQTQEYTDSEPQPAASKKRGRNPASAFDFSDPQAVDKFAAEVSWAISGEEEAAKEQETLRRRFSIFGKRNHSGVLPEDEVELPEPDMKDELARYEKGLGSMMYRSIAAFVLCLVMILFTFLGEAGKNLPFGVDQNMALAAGTLAMLQILVMMLCIEVPVHGVVDLIRLRPGAESLVTVSAVLSLIHAFVILANGGAENGLPYCAITAFAVFSAMRGRFYHHAAMRNSLKGAVAGENPYGVICEFSGGEDKAVLRKVSGMEAGFFRNLTAADISEQLYSLLTPFFVIGALVLALLAAIVSGDIREYARCASAMLAAAGSFSAMYAYNLPFRKVSRGARSAGGIVAGWGGAAEIFDADCAILTDTDLFPKGTVSLNGYKVFEHADHSEGVAHTASLMIASGSELAPIFKELLKSEGLPVEPVEDFQCYEGGGIGATVRGDRVFAGTAAFMHLQGIRIPESVNITNAVYTVINGRLAAVFAMNYEPVTSVQGALLTILRMKLGMFFAVRDFNLTPTMIQQRYKVNVEGGRYLPVEDCYRITGAAPAEHCRTDALLTREGLGPFSEAIMRGRHLKVVAELSAVLAALGSIIGFVIVFILLAGGAFESAAAGNILIFMLAIHALVLGVASLPQRPR